VPMKSRVKSRRYFMVGCQKWPWRFQITSENKPGRSRMRLVTKAWLLERVKFIYSADLKSSQVDRVAILFEERRRRKGFLVA